MADEDRPRPNSVLIFTDDLGWGDPGIAGHPINSSPMLAMREGR